MLASWSASIQLQNYGIDLMVMNDADKRVQSVSQAPEEQPDCSSQWSNGAFLLRHAFRAGPGSAYRKRAFEFESPKGCVMHITLAIPPGQQPA